MEAITSRTNPNIKLAVKLRQQTSLRRERRLFFLEGARLCHDAAQSGVQIETLFVSPQALEKYAGYLDIILTRANACYTVTDAACSALGDTQTPQGVFCVCRIPDTTLHTLLPGNCYLALDQIQDPANLGSIIRSCDALGLHGLIVGGGCDVYHPKVLRAAMGAVFRLPISVQADLSVCLQQAKQQNIRTLAAVVADDATDIRTLSKQAGGVLVVGNEGNGVQTQTLALCQQRVTIPMPGNAESLNVAAAAAIFAWEFVR